MKTIRIQIIEAERKGRSRMHTKEKSKTKVMQTICRQLLVIKAKQMNKKNKKKLIYIRIEADVHIKTISLFAYNSQINKAYCM